MTRADNKLNKALENSAVSCETLIKTSTVLSTFCGNIGSCAVCSSESLRKRHRASNGPGTILKALLNNGTGCQSQWGWGQPQAGSRGEGGRSGEGVCLDPGVLGHVISSVNPFLILISCSCVLAAWRSETPPPSPSPPSPTPPSPVHFLKPLAHLSQTLHIRSSSPPL